MNKELRSDMDYFVSLAVCLFNDDHDLPKTAQRFYDTWEKIKEEIDNPPKVAEKDWLDGFEKSYNDYVSPIPNPKGNSVHVKPYVSQSFESMKWYWATGIGSAGEPDSYKAHYDTAQDAARAMAEAGYGPHAVDPLSIADKTDDGSGWTYKSSTGDMAFVVGCPQGMCDKPGTLYWVHYADNGDWNADDLFNYTRTKSQVIDLLRSKGLL